VEDVAAVRGDRDRHAARPRPQAYVPLKTPSAGDASAAWAEAAKAMLSSAAFANLIIRFTHPR
jgi:hypothetical protein